MAAVDAVRDGDGFGSLVDATGRASAVLLMVPSTIDVARNATDGGSGITVRTA